MHETIDSVDITADLTGLQCPHLLFAVIALVREGDGGAMVEISADDLNAPSSVGAWARQSGCELIDMFDDGNTFTFLLKIPQEIYFRPKHTMESIPVDIPIHDKNYGFVIDNRKCIGCHACSVACKSENEVPLSVNRTWVKYVETGIFPNSRRHSRSHAATTAPIHRASASARPRRCTSVPTALSNSTISTVSAAKRASRHVPTTRSTSIPIRETAAKCHYCAHRTEVNLEPACVVVCPEHAIISGDMNDPNSEIAQLLATQKVTVRKPEQGTAPKLFYINGNDVALHPTATERVPETYLWADAMPLHGGNGHANDMVRPKAAPFAHRLPFTPTAPLCGHPAPRHSHPVVPFKSPMVAWRSKWYRSPTTRSITFRGTGRCRRISSQKESAPAFLCCWHLASGWAV